MSRGQCYKLFRPSYYWMMASDFSKSNFLKKSEIRSVPGDGSHCTLEPRQESQ